MKIRYEIQADPIAVKVFFEENTVPTLYQPHFPNGTVWADQKEAEDWAKLYVKSIEDESAPFAPNGRGEEGRAKPTKEEIEAMKAQMEAMRPTPPSAK